MSDSLFAYYGKRILEQHDFEVKAACEASLIELTSYLWPVIDPGQHIVTGWAMDAIAAHIEACALGHIKRLLITVPPGFSKSSLCNIFGPLWIWLREPHARFIHASYEKGIPERDNLRFRNIIGSEEYRRFWADKFHLVVPNTVEKLANDKTGWKMATSVGGKLIGYRANYIIIDDPNDPDVENQSGLKRQEAVRWFRETVPTRLNDMANDVIIVIQQRLHQEDVAGTALRLEHENYCHLNVPMEWEAKRYVNAYNVDNMIETFADEDVDQVAEEDIFWQDPRGERYWEAKAQANALGLAPDDPDQPQEGELAWPERFSEAVVEKMKATMGKTMVAAQLQQRPVPRGGNIIADAWWKVWKEDKFPPFNFILATLDTAYTEDEMNDPMGMMVWGLAPDEYQNPRIFLIHAHTDFYELNKLVRYTLHTCTRNDVNYGKDLTGLPRFPVDRLVIEGKSAGLSVQQELARLVSTGQGRTLGVDILPGKLLRDDKLSRLVSVSHLFENGVIWAPDKSWVDKVIEQVGGFPRWSHDEYVDCTTMALRWLRDCGYAPTREEVFEEQQTEMAYRGQRAIRPLYGGIE